MVAIRGLFDRRDDSMVKFVIKGGKNDRSWWRYRERGDNGSDKRWLVH